MVEMAILNLEYPSLRDEVSNDREKTKRSNPSVKSSDRSVNIIVPLLQQIASLRPVAIVPGLSSQ